MHLMLNLVPNFTCHGRPWMPPTTLACDSIPVDFDHLKRITLGERALEREVLELFLKQAAGLVEGMTDLPAETATLAHTLSGSGRAVGAFRIADCAAMLEEVARRGGQATGDGAAALAALKQAMDEARPAIEARLCGP